MPDNAEMTIYKAWRNALINDEAITAFVPAAKIYLGPRKDDAPLPSLSISKVGESPTEKVSGAAVSGGEFITSPTFQIEIASNETMTEIINITGVLLDNLLKDNSYLRAAKISNVTKIGEMEYRDARNVLCRALRFSFVYRFILSS